MLTARGNLKDKLDVLSLGIDDYITKPFSKEELIIRIHNALINNEKKKSYTNDTPESTDNSTDEKFLTSLKDYILRTCSNLEFELEDIVEEFAISKSTIYRKIKHATGLNPNQFINEIKLQKARAIVESNQMDSLKQLSYSVGFTKPSYFSKLYEKRFGSKPFQKRS
ncbi:helix-turn-helix domain-containing protein [Flavivirga aquimarina]|uniref:Helix-turn-helix domain-containing protein n=1 Tax=Flavivirga aquimarina TaxID=2027862 RepID=A0ABT8W925_9FLAO|nr:helix-turn-helix domain-containing protein [Flavivirga aquimarina]MDO5969552.1 helix-turn-helix domain-containing protein [Flavivirga aquimarina]